MSVNTICIYIHIVATIHVLLILLLLQLLLLLHDDMTYTQYDIKIAVLFLLNKFKKKNNTLAWGDQN